MKDSELGRAPYTLGAIHDYIRHTISPDRLVLIIPLYTTNSRFDTLPTR